MARFFLEEAIAGEEAHISGDDAAHISRVLRLQPGEQIELVIVGQPYLAELTHVSPQGTTARLLHPLNGNSESPLEINLYQALLKGEKMDLVIQKATELGVTSITPVSTARVVVKLKPDAVKGRVGRWQRITEEAAKQSRRLRIPQVKSLIKLEQVEAAPDALRLVAWEASVEPLASLLQSRGHRRVDLFIGPEGGLTADEIATLQSKGFLSVSLGPRILRAETAPLSLLSVIQYELGDLGGKMNCHE